MSEDKYLIFEAGFLPVCLQAASVESALCGSCGTLSCVGNLVFWSVTIVQGPKVRRSAGVNVCSCP